MKLVNIHKRVLFLLLLPGWNVVKAQEIWSLKKCIDTAQVHNKSLQIETNNIEMGDKKNREARANRNPRLTVATDYKYYTDLPHQFMPLSAFNPTAPDGEFKIAQFGVPHNVNANLQLAIPLFNPMIEGAIGNTEIATRLTKLQYQKTEEQIYFDVTTLYYNGQLIIHQIEFIDSNRINTQKLLKNMQLLHEQLLARASDVGKVKLQAGQLTTQRENAKNKLAQILNALKLAMGIDLEKDIAIEKDIVFRPAVSYNPQSIVDLQIINTKNDLLNNELKVLHKSTYLPTISLVGTYGASGFGYDKRPNNFLKFYPIGFAGVQLTYPLFNGTVTKRQMEQKKLEIKNNELQTQIIQDKNQTGIENATRQREVALSSIHNTEKQIELAKTIYNQTVIQQKQGTASLSEILMADNALREAQQDYLTATIDYLKADLELKKLTGRIRE